MDGNFPIRDLLPLRPQDIAPYQPARQPVLVSLTEKVFAWIERVRSRRTLGLLDDRMLRDIGVDQGSVYNEVQKPFWRS